MRLLDEQGGQFMRKEDLKNWTRDMLKDKILYQEALLEQRNKDIEIISKRAKELNDENDLVKAENASLKQRIKDLEDICDGSCFSDGEDEKDKLIAELQDQHQQDCIRYNDYLFSINRIDYIRFLERLRGWIDGF